MSVGHAVKEYIGWALAIVHLLLWIWIGTEFIAWLNAVNPYALATWMPFLIFAWIVAFVCSFFLVGWLIGLVVRGVRRIFV